MAEEIVNRVAKSGLIQLDLEALLPDADVSELDISPWLFEGMVLREKDFKTHLTEHNWEQYKGHYLAIHCSEEAIIPPWAYMMIVREAAPFAIKVYKGDRQFAYNMLIKEAIDNLDIEAYKDGKVVIKGCGSGKFDEFAYAAIAQKLIGVAKSMMYGEPCSTVPIYKRK